MPAFGEQRLLGRFSERVYFRLFGVADAGHYLRHLYLKRYLDGLGEFAPHRILDAGCGRGDHSFWLARRYPDAQVVGIDIDGGRVQRNSERAPRLGIGNATFAVNNLAGFSAEPFDLVVSIDVLEHIEDRRAALTNLRRLCRGKAYFHVPTVRPVPVPLSRWLHGFHEWAAHEHHDLPSAESFASEVTAAGFRVDTVTRTFGRMTGELACSLFNLPYQNTAVNQLLQAALSLPCRALLSLDGIDQHIRYAVAVGSSCNGPAGPE